LGLSVVIRSGYEWEQVTVTVNGGERYGCVGNRVYWKTSSR